MAFTTKRGRPSTKNYNHSDLGTPELIKKRIMDVTTEAIDICLNKGLITTEQHWCGIHLRWLYTLRYGVPSVKALDTTHMGGRELNSDNPEWRKEREKEYNEAILAIQNMTHIKAVLECCVFNQRPIFLRYKQTPQSLSTATRVMHHHAFELNHLCSGLDALVNLWCKKPAAANK